MISQIVLLGFFALAAARVESTLPTLELPWGTWQASVYEQDDQIYIFRNVRFGAQPERFGRPFFPDQINSTLQNITYDISCIQINSTKLEYPPGGRMPVGDPSNREVVETEDCLFLDVYAPISAFESNGDPLPVVVWINGGGYASRSKNPSGPFSSGQSMLRASNYSIVFIEGNYRLGAFGWLAGDYLQKVGQPNAGLYDQALLLEWVQKYVDRVKGDKTHVSAWGESAGAGSILHHLIREDGTRDPLFSTFAIQSPAFQWAWDNSPGGLLDSTYRNFSELAECGLEYDIECLRSAPLKQLTAANQKMFDAAQLTGLFPVGPSVDGNWIKSIPAVTLSQGKFWKGIESAIISHCANETAFFTPNILDQEHFDQFLDGFFPGTDLEPEKDAVKKQYNCTTDFGGDFQACLSTIIRDSSFTCNTRDLFDAYPTVSYMIQYAFLSAENAFHATDVLPLFANSKDEVIGAVNALIKDEDTAEAYAERLYLANIPEEYQNYFAGFGLTGDPNKSPSPPTLQWPIANGSNNLLTDVMEVTYNWLHPSKAFRLVTDNQNSNDTCSFWRDIAERLTERLHTGDESKVQDIDEL
ncbi:alpha/beta-hydrolase [Daldinia sp. FL1419]|nr:alpha/beta-hydrolase [Daldinia sp. FL1419]